VQNKPSRRAFCTRTATQSRKSRPARLARLLQLLMVWVCRPGRWRRGTTETGGAKWLAPPFTHRRRRCAPSEHAGRQLANEQGCGGALHVRPPVEKALGCAMCARPALASSGVRNLRLMCHNLVQRLAQSMHARPRIQARADFIRVLELRRLSKGSGASPATQPGAAVCTAFQPALGHRWPAALRALKPLGRMPQSPGRRGCGGRRNQAQVARLCR
jgi:hypothetical protein